MAAAQQTVEAELLHACDCYLHEHQVCDICQGVDQDEPISDNRQNSLDNLVHYKPGRSGNPLGRPKGSRNKLSQDFYKDVHALWLTHGNQALTDMLAADPIKFCQMVASTLPKHIDVDVTDTKWVINASSSLSVEDWQAEHGLAAPTEAVEGITEDKVG